MSKDDLIKFAIKHNIKLRKSLNKAQIINKILSHIQKLKDLKIYSEILSKKFIIIRGPDNTINISIWFKGDKDLLKKCIESPKFQSLLRHHAGINKTKKKEAQKTYIIEKYGATFAPPILALHAASFLEIESHYNISKFHLCDKYNQIAEISTAEFKIFKKQLLTLTDRFKSQSKNFVYQFNAQHALYYFVIGNTVKCGAVGVTNGQNSENLDLRLSTHRSAFVKFKLINVIIFTNSEEVTTFENWIKQVLAKYSVGSVGKKVPLEQYECKGANTEKIINEIILEEFEEMNSAEASLCDKTRINEYNESIKNLKNF